jgi:hypothetical protein
VIPVRSIPTLVGALVALVLVGWMASHTATSPRLYADASSVPPAASQGR